MSEEEELKFGKLIINQHDLEFQIDTKVGTFTFRYLRPRDWTIIRGATARSLSNANRESLDDETVELARAHGVLDYATKKGGAPPGWDSFADFPNRDFVLDIHKKYMKQVNEVEDSIQKKLEEIK